MEENSSSKQELVSKNAALLNLLILTIHKKETELLRSRT